MSGLIFTEFGKFGAIISLYGELVHMTFHFSPRTMLYFGVLVNVPQFSEALTFFSFFFSLFVFQSG